MYNKKSVEKAFYDNKIEQFSDGKCRTMDVLEEQVRGKFFRKGRKHRYYTAKLFDRLFFTHGRVCGHEPEPGKNYREELPENAGSSKMEKHVSELKKLIFSPGEQADIPLIGRKTAIFSEHMIKYYDLSITSGTYKKQQACYVFTAKVKDAYLESKKGKTVIKYLETYFEKSTFQVLARKYALQYVGLLFDFDVEMKIELRKFEGFYVPEYLEYKGRWDVPARKPEISRFYARFYDYRRP